MRCRNGSASVPSHRSYKPPLSTGRLCPEWGCPGLGVPADGGPCSHQHFVGSRARCSAGPCATGRAGTELLIEHGDIEQRPLAFLKIPFPPAPQQQQRSQRAESAGCAGICHQWPLVPTHLVPSALSPCWVIPDPDLGAGTARGSPSCVFGAG